MVKVIFIVGLILRLLLPMQRVFNFDQDQIALNAWEIAHGNLTVLGPQTSNTSFFTGPLIYYVAAIFYRLTNFHPVANALTGAATYVLSFWLIGRIFRRMFFRQLMFLYLAIYALSPFLVQMGRITWNPNFSFISGSLVLAALLKPNYLSIWLGMFLAYQASFSGFVIPVILLLYLFFKRRRLKLITVGFLGLAVSLFPLLLFDLKHQFMNFNSLRQFIFEAAGGAGGGFISQIKPVVLINFENFAKIFTGYFYPQVVLVILGLALFIFWLRQPKSFFSREQKKTLLLWMAAFPVAGLFYHDDLPEYYFLMQLPALLMMMADLVNLLAKKQLGLILTFMALVSLGVVFSSDNGYTLRHKYDAAKYIKSRSAGRPLELIFAMDYAERFGWDNLIKYWQIRLADRSERDRVELIFPVYPQTIRDAEFGKIGVYYVPK